MDEDENWRPIWLSALLEGWMEANHCSMGSLNEASDLGTRHCKTTSEVWRISSCLFSTQIHIIRIYFSHVIPNNNNKNSPPVSINILCYITSRKVRPNRSFILFPAEENAFNWHELGVMVIYANGVFIEIDSINVSPLPTSCKKSRLIYKTLECGGAIKPALTQCKFYFRLFVGSFSNKKWIVVA